MRWSKAFSKTGLLALMLAVVGIGIFFYERQYCGAEQPARYEPQQLRQVITADSKTSRTIMWQTHAPESDAWVEYKLQGENELHRVRAQGKEFATDSGTVYQQSVTLTALEPGTVYEYRAGGGKEFSAWQTLKTDTGGAFTALIFGDSQSLDYNVWRKTAAYAYSHDPEAAFFINMGDLVDNGEQYSQWRSWFRGASGLLPQIPVAPISGNHENYSLQWKPYRGDLYLNLFDLPLNGPEGLQKQAYSYDYGDVHFSVIDTQQEELNEWKPELIASQVSWLERDLAAMADFGQRCREILSAYNPGGDHAPIAIKGSHDLPPHKRVPFHPSAGDRCMKCNACANACPAGAIPKETPWVTDDDKCISCGACIYLCPTQTRQYRGEAYETAAKGFEAKCAKRREPEVFF